MMSFCDARNFRTKKIGIGLDVMLKKRERDVIDTVNNKWNVLDTFVGKLIEITVEW